jgi:hypothetical protein
LVIIPIKGRGSQGLKKLRSCDKLLRAMLGLKTKVFPVIFHKSDVFFLIERVFRRRGIGDEEVDDIR